MMCENQPTVQGLLRHILVVCIDHLCPLISTKVNSRPGLPLLLCCPLVRGLLMYEGTASHRGLFFSLFPVFSMWYSFYAAEKLWLGKCDVQSVIGYESSDNVEIFQLQITYFSINLGNYPWNIAVCLELAVFFLSSYPCKDFQNLKCPLKSYQGLSPVLFPKLSSLWHYSTEKKCCLPTLCGGISSSSNIRYFPAIMLKEL